MNLVNVGWFLFFVFLLFCGTMDSRQQRQQRGVPPLLRLPSYRTPAEPVADVEPVRQLRELLPCPWCGTEHVHGSLAGVLIDVAACARPGWWSRLWGADTCAETREHLHAKCGRCCGTWLVRPKS